MDDTTSHIVQRRLQKAGTKPVEVYGFVLWISSFLSYIAYILYAFLPESILHHIGVYYYPSKWWAISLPMYFCVLFVGLIIIYTGYNMYCTNPLQSSYTVTDEFANTHIARRILVSHSTSNNMNSMETIPDVYDIPIREVNKRLYINNSNNNS